MGFCDFPRKSIFAGCGQDRAGKKKGGRKAGEQMGNGFAVPTPGNRFSKYSGIVVPAGRKN